MKALRCQNECGRGLSRAVLRARQMLGYPVIMLPGGAPYVIGTVTSFPLDARCAACKRPSRYTAVEFARLPTLSADDLAAIGLLKALMRDWEGDGLPPERAAQLVGAGVMGPASIVSRRQEAPPPTWPTGSKCRTSGVYRSGDTTIPLSRGERFPPAGKGARWTLVSEA